MIGVKMRKGLWVMGQTGRCHRKMPLTFRLLPGCPGRRGLNRQRKWRSRGGKEGLEGGVEVPNYTGGRAPCSFIREQ
mgnify:CR=1 FL=1